MTAAAIGAAAVGALAGRQQFTTVPGPVSASPSLTPRASGLSEFVRLDDAVAQFSSTGGPAVWAPDSLRVAVERAQRAEHLIDLVGTDDWKTQLTLSGSRPAWSPDGGLLAFLAPFSPTVPPDPATTVNVVDSVSGALRWQRPIATVDLGWAGEVLYGIVAGVLQPLWTAASGGPATTSPVSCAGGCGSAQWCSPSSLVALSGNDAPYPVEVHDLAKNPSRQITVGAIDALAIASGSPALAWLRSGLVHAWTPRDGEGEIKDLAGRRPVFWSGHGEVLFARDDRANSWTQWHRETGRVREARLPAEISGGGPMFCSPDSRYLAAIVSESRFASLKVYPVVGA